MANLRDINLGVFAPPQPADWMDPVVWIEGLVDDPEVALPVLGGLLVCVVLSLVVLSLWRRVGSFIGGLMWGWTAFAWGLWLWNWWWYARTALGIASWVGVL